MLPRSFDLSDGQRVHVRTAVAADAGLVIEHIDAVCAETDFLSFGPGERPRTVAETEQRIVEYDAAPHALYLIALVDHRAAGLLSFSCGGKPRVRHSGSLGMTVRQSHWGLGIGSRLLDAVVDWARAGGVVTKLNLQVRTDNARAIALYRKKGFELEGTIRRDFRIGDRYHDHYWMGLILQ